MKNEKGITLIEILATIIILTIVMSLTMNLLVSSQTQHKNQTAENRQLNDMSNALKLLTKDMRQSDDVTILSPSEFNYDFKDGPSVKYNFDSSSGKGNLYRDGVLISSNLKRFAFELKNDNDKREFSISLENEKNGSFDTTLYYRGRGSD